MTRRRSLLGVAALLAAAPAAGAQAPGTLRAVEALAFADFYEMVLRRHPVARQARLVEDVARAELLAARGAQYDPTLRVGLRDKTLLGSESYNFVEATVEVPTPIGIDVRAGFERGRGGSLDPERRTAPRGQFIVGATVPLARGLVSDERRNALQQAVAVRDQAIGERQAAVNKLLFGAAKDYAVWYEAGRRLRIADDGVELADQRLRLVRSRYLNGESAALDTVEAALEVQRRRVTRLEAAAAFFGATQAVNSYLWDDDGRPLDLGEGVRPSLAGLEPRPLDPDEIDRLLREALRRHPDILKAAGKVRQTEAARLFFAQGLLPEATLDVEAFGNRDSIGFFLDRWPAVADNNKASLKAKSALLLMKERGKFASSRFKLQSAELDLAFTERAVALTVAAALFDARTFEEVLEAQVLAVEQAQALVAGEQLRFENGESTLFLVTIRERVLLDERVKLATSEAKYAAARAALAVALGLPAVLPGE